MGILDRIAALLSRRRPARAEPAPVEDGIDRWLVELRRTSGESATGGLLPAAVQETDGELVVTTEIPGFRRDEVEVVTTGDVLIIGGEKRERRGDGAAEIRYGRFTYRLPLPPGVDAERARAQVDDGVLTVRIPKSAQPAASPRVKLTA